MTDSSSTRGLVEFTTKNFAMVSGVTALVAYLIGTVFLYSYLSFFDWRLIWLVEYADVIKFGLVAFAGSRKRDTTVFAAVSSKCLSHCFWGTVASGNFVFVRCFLRFLPAPTVDQ